MKKKIILSILAIFMLSVCVIGVKAESVKAEKISMIDFTGTDKAKAPTVIPSSNDLVYATLTDLFDFSRVKFKNKSGGADIAGITDLRKIVLSKTLNYDASDLKLESLFGKDWFTAYCLDGELKYPQHGIYTSQAYYDALTAYNAATDNDVKNAKAKDMLDALVAAAVANDGNLRTLLQKANGYINNEGIKYTIADGKTVNDIIPNGIKSNDFKVDINSITFSKVENGKAHYISFISTDEDMAGVVQIDCTNTVNSDGTVTCRNSNYNNIEYLFVYINSQNKTTHYQETLKLKDVLFNIYTTTSDLNNKKYEQALWILEHSYPTLNIDETLSLAGVDKDKLITELKALDNRIADTNLNDYLIDYIYATIQYSISYVYGGKENLGNEIANKDVLPELNKLYTFYIQERSEYDGYTNVTNGSITINKPKEGKELKETKDKVYKYGPYSAKFTGLMASDSNNELSLSIKNSDKTGIKIVNASGTEINSISPDQEFYIEVAKDAKLGSVEIRTSVVASTFIPAANRGRIYYPKYVLAQNVMSGGQIGKDTINKDFTITINAKTGVENVAVLLMVTLVAFSLGYLVLSYKGKGRFF